MKELNEEVSRKLELIREAVTETGATAGGSNTVLVTAEAGVAEVLVTVRDAWVLTVDILTGLKAR